MSHGKNFCGERMGNSRGVFGRRTMHISSGAAMCQMLPGPKWPTVTWPHDSIITVHRGLRNPPPPFWKCYALENKFRNNMKIGSVLQDRISSSPGSSHLQGCYLLAWSPARIQLLRFVGLILGNALWTVLP